MNAQKLQSSVECAGQPELLVKDGDYQIGSYSNPYLRLHGVGACPIVMLDSQVSLDPTEEQFDAPSHLVKHSHCQSGDLQVVGQEDEFLCGFRIEEFHSPEENWKGLPGLRESWFANMIALQAGEPIHRLGVMPGELKVALCSRYKKGSSVCDQNESCEVHVTSIHQIERSGLEQEAVEPSHVVLPRSRDIDTGRNRSAQVDLCVDFDPSLGLTEIGPRKESQGKIDSCRIQRIDRIFQIQTKILARIERPGFAHQTLGQILPDTPVPVFVGIGESRFGNRFAETKMIESLGPGVETGRDVAQPVPGSHLCENHTSELLPESKMADRECGFVTLYYAVERLAVDQVENLGENEAAGVHGRKFWEIPPQSSNPSHAFLSLIDSFEMSSRNSNSI
jgi:hypothetical protein